MQPIQPPPKPTRQEIVLKATLPKGGRLHAQPLPDGCSGKSLRGLLSRKDWNELRKETYKRAGHKCEICSGQGTKRKVDCHEDWDLSRDGIQRLAGLQALCPECHQAIHIRTTVRGQPGTKCRNHIAKVNGWTAQQAEAHIAQAMKTRAERGRSVWSLDLYWLVEHDEKPQKSTEGAAAL